MVMQMREDGASEAEIRRDLQQRGLETLRINELLHASLHKAGCSTEAAVDIVTQMREDGVCESRVREELQRRGY